MRVNEEIRTKPMHWMLLRRTSDRNVVEEMNVIDFLKTCGIFGIASLGTGLVLAIIALIMVCIIRNRKPFIILAVVCIFPLLLGIAGTALGYQQVQNHSRVVESPDPATIEHGKNLAKRTTYLGGGITFVLLGICFAAITTKGKKTTTS